MRHMAARPTATPQGSGGLLRAALSLLEWPPAGSDGPVAPFPPLGPSVRCPSFFGTTRQSDFLMPFSLRFVSLRVRYHSFLGLFLATTGRRAPPVILESFSRTPSRWFGGDIRISQVPRKSAWGMPWSGDPGEFQHALPCRRTGCCLPMLVRRRHSRWFGFSGLDTRPASSLSTLRGPCRHGQRKTRFRLMASRCRAGDPLDFDTRFHGVISSSRFSSSELSCRKLNSQPSGFWPR